MPILYAFDPDFGFIHTRCVGETTLDQVRDHLRALASGSLPPRVDVLLDLTETHSLPESDQLRAVAAEIRRTAANVKWGAFAIAAKSDVMFGLSRMLAVFAEEQFTRTHVFRDVASARRWLGGGDKGPRSA
jgi:hypothetical protein